MFGLRWFGKQQPGSLIRPRTWQAWVVIGIYAVATFAIHTLQIDPGVRRQLWGIATGLLLVIVALTYQSD